jgi:RimJ/RimL family protein N-acetyltransferase
MVKKNTELIARIDLTVDKKFNRAEIGYWLNIKYWNKGLIAHALKTVIHTFTKVQKNKDYQFGW